MLGDDVVISLDGVFVLGSIEEGDDVPAKDGALVGETTGSVELGLELGYFRFVQMALRWVGDGGCLLTCPGVFPLCPNGALLVPVLGVVGSTRSILLVWGDCWTISVCCATWGSSLTKS